jgi:hypothetical protein
MPSTVTQYHLMSRWSMDAPVGAVWTELSRPEGWPAWWRGIVAVRLLEQGDNSGLGAYRQVIWQGVLPARLTFNLRTVKIEPRALIESVADGELTGVGRWQLSRVSGGTLVQHDWIVNVSLPDLPLIGAVAGVLFKWNHRLLMEAGRHGMESRVGVRLPTPPAT